MKKRRTVLSAGIAAAMILGTVLALPGTAQAAVGAFTMTGTLGGVAVTAVGKGTVGPSIWTGSFIGTGSSGCIAHTFLRAGGW